MALCDNEQAALTVPKRHFRDTKAGATQTGPRVPIATGLRKAFAEGYDATSFRADLMAGIVVGIVALPLSMALAIATGVPPQHGLYTAIVAGSLVALLGGSRYQVTGPTAAFVVILAPIAAKHGLHGLLTAGFLAGILLILMGFARLGRFIQFIPHPVTTGFTAGIATVIATLQLKDAFGLKLAESPESFIERLEAYWAARGTVSLAEVGIAAATLALLLLVPKVTRKIPAPLVAISIVAASVTALRMVLPELSVDTIGSRFQTTIGDKVYAGIPPVPPTPMLPWGDHPITLSYLRELLPSALAIAMLGAIESLLSAVIADGMTGDQHDPNAELIALGAGNVVAPFFGGIAATGALARTATNVRAGARSPIAAAMHAVIVTASILLLAPLVAYVPMASLAALLLLVAWNMSEMRHFQHILKVAPRSDVVVLLTCYFLTVIFDMVIAVTVGVVLAAILFMRRMAELTATELHAPGKKDSLAQKLPNGVALYRIDGPLFFGAAQQAMSALGAIRSNVRVIILDLSNVPTIDATGLVALESALERLNRQKRFLVLAGPLPAPQYVFEKANLDEHHENVIVAKSLESALEIARDIVRLNPDWAAMASGATPIPGPTSA